MSQPFFVLLCVLGMAFAGCSGPARASAAPAASDEVTVARKLYAAKCAKCHQLYDPAKYTDAEWTKWMGKMSRKSKLKPEQQEMLSRYIEQTYRAPRKSSAP